MPEFLERSLRAAARKKGLKGEHADHYVYGAMNNIGAMHGSKETAKGREMEKKHMKDHGIRRISIEVNRGKDGKITGHTVSHDMVPKPSKKGTGAFYDHVSEQYPFSANDHKGMMAHVSKALNGSKGGTAAGAAGTVNSDDEADE